LIYPRRI